MSTSDYISIAALIIAIVSVAFTGYVLFRDKARVKARCRLMKYGRNECEALEVEAVNHGHRPIVLTQLEKRYKNGWVGTLLGEKGHGVKLEEQQRYQDRLAPYERVDENGLHREIDLRFLDTAGKGYAVKDAHRNLEQLYETVIKYEEQGNGVSP